MDIKLLPFNARGMVDISAVDPVSITPDQRAARPYPPGKVRINGVAWPDGATLHGDVTLSWAHRLRTAQADTAVVSQDADSTTTIPEGTYTVEILIAGVVKRTVSGVTDTSVVYTLAQRAADDADSSKTVQFRITPVGATLDGSARTTDSFLMAA